MNNRVKDEQHIPKDRDLEEVMVVVELIFVEFLD